MSNCFSLRSLFLFLCLRVDQFVFSVNTPPRSAGSLWFFDSLFGPVRATARVDRDHVTCSEHSFSFCGLAIQQDLAAANHRTDCRSRQPFKLLSQGPIQPPLPFHELEQDLYAGRRAGELDSVWTGLREPWPKFWPSDGGIRHRDAAIPSMVAVTLVDLVLVDLFAVGVPSDLAGIPEFGPPAAPLAVPDDGRALTFKAPYMPLHGLHPFNAGMRAPQAGIPRS